MKPEGYYTQQEVLKLLNRSRTWLWRMRRDGKIQTAPFDQNRFPAHQFTQFAPQAALPNNEKPLCHAT